jgi:hypothetical protein
MVVFTYPAVAAMEVVQYMPHLEDRHLITICQAENRKINDLRLGATLEKKSGQTIDQLAANALKDRLTFANRTLKTAKEIAREHRTQKRLTIARSY